MNKVKSIIPTLSAAAFTVLFIAAAVLFPGNFAKTRQQAALGNTEVLPMESLP